jgi:hypothetical protein
MEKAYLEILRFFPRCHILASRDMARWACYYGVTARVRSSFFSLDFLRPISRPAVGLPHRHCMIRPTHELLISLYRIGLLPAKTAQRELLALIDAQSVNRIMPAVPAEFAEDLWQQAKNYDPAISSVTLAGVPYMSREISSAVMTWFADKVTGSPARHECHSV